MAQEMSYQTSGIDASVSAGGVKLNMIRRTAATASTDRLKCPYPAGCVAGENNLTQRLQDSRRQRQQRDRLHLDLSGSPGRSMRKKDFGSSRPHVTTAPNGVTNTFPGQRLAGQGLQLHWDALGV